MLNALLGSREFADLPVRFLRAGRDLIHCSGWGRSYSTRERLRGLFSPIAPILHNPSQKASDVLDPSTEIGAHATVGERLFLEISPYLTLARRYEADLAPQTAWLHYRTPLGSLLRALGCGHYALAGLPLIVPLSMRKALHRILAKFRSQSERPRWLPPSVAHRQNEGGQRNFSRESLTPDVDPVHGRRSRGGHQPAPGAAEPARAVSRRAADPLSSRGR